MRAGGGIDLESLAWVLYPSVSKAAAKRCLAVNVHHINSKLVETDYEIRMTERCGKYRLVRCD